LIEQVSFIETKRCLIETSWNDEVRVWIATSTDVLGLVVEAETIAELRQEIELLLPEFIDLNGIDLPKMEYSLRCSTPKTLSL
jgi:hypothetical protein